MQYDIAIIGGGPAGAAAALTLRQLDPALRVAVVERSRYDHPRIGETLPPLAQPLLARLGAWPAFAEAGFAPAYGTSAAWGAPAPFHHEFLLRPHGHGWHLDRRAFDRLLAAQAQSQGAALLLGTWVAAHERTREGWRLALAGDAAPGQALSARFVIDAGGRSAGFARRQGARLLLYDKLVAAARFVPANAELPTLVEACPQGWWYSAGLPGGGAVLALMSDADLLRASTYRSAQGWLAALGAAPHTSRRLPGAAGAAAPELWSARTQRLSTPVGAGWLAAGDAASTFDPLSSQGIVKSLRGGTLAAYAAYDTLGGRPEALERYAALIAAEFASYLETWGAFYAQEQRWPGAPFWKRRAAL